ncbi:MAG: HDOD domain-containing protein [Myxococcota bacterium]
MMGQRRQHASYGQGSHTIDVELLDESELIAELRGLFAREDYRPPMPPTVALEVHALSKRPDADVDAVVALLEKDAMLTADVLRIAQSPSYATRIPPRTLSEAVMRLGLKNLVQIVWQAALGARVFKAKAYEQPMESLRRHSVAMAHATRMVAAHTSVAEDQGFLFGLLHDIGYAAIFIALSERRGREPIDIANEVAALEALHPEAGETLAQVWNLPKELELCIGHHDVAEIQGYAHPLLATGLVAQELVEELGHGLAHGSEPLEKVSRAAVTHARETVALGDAALEKIREQLAERLERAFG